MKKRLVGILGASADPFHAGHKGFVAHALATLPILDEIQVMVTPQNPDKVAAPIPIEHRLHLAALELSSLPGFGVRVKVSDFEAQLARFGVPNETVHTLEHFSDTYQELQPVWLMGSDSFATLHTWGDRWQEIMDRYPVVVFARSGDDLSIKEKPAAVAFANRRVLSTNYSCVPGTWTIVDDYSHPASSTEVRAAFARGERSPYLSDLSHEHISQHGLYRQLAAVQ